LTKRLLCVMHYAASVTQGNTQQQVPLCAPTALQAHSPLLADQPHVAPALAMLEDFGPARAVGLYLVHATSVVQEHSLLLLEYLRALLVRQAHSPLLADQSRVAPALAMLEAFGPALAMGLYLVRATSVVQEHSLLQQEYHHAPTVQLGPTGLPAVEMHLPVAPHAKLVNTQLLWVPVQPPPASTALQGNTGSLQGRLLYRTASTALQGPSPPPQGPPSRQLAPRARPARRFPTWLGRPRALHAPLRHSVYPPSTSGIAPPPPMGRAWNVNPSSANLQTLTGSVVVSITAPGLATGILHCISETLAACASCAERPTPAPSGSTPPRAQP
jgi:hypothetical protein